MSAYSDAINALSPIAYWRLGEASGVDAFDETGNHDGSYINTPTLGASSLITSDPIDTAVSFTAAQNEHVSVPHHADLNLGANFSIIAWAKFTTAPTFAALFGKYHGGTAKGFMLLVNFNNDNKPRLWTKDTAATSVAGTSLVNDGITHMIVGTLEGGIGRIYVDGGPAENSASLQTPGANTAALKLADAGTTFSRPFNGVEDDAVAFDFALSPAQIANLYAIASAPPFAPAIGLSIAALSFAAGEEGADPADQTFDVTNEGDGGSQLNWTGGDDMAWLTLVPNSGGPLAKDASKTVTVSVDVSGLAVGIHTGTITISDPAASNTPQTIAVTLTVYRRPEQAITLRRRKTGTAGISIGDSVS